MDLLFDLWETWKWLIVIIFKLIMSGVIIGGIVVTWAQNLGSVIGMIICLIPTAILLFLLYHVWTWPGM
jgi:hypothetical protein